MANDNSSSMNMSGNSSSMNMGGSSSSMHMGCNSTSTHIGHGMAHMSMSSGISLTFGIVILAVCAAVTIHMLWTLLRKQFQLKNLSGHNTKRHSIPMTLGMISAMAAGIAIGGVMETQLTAAYIIGFGVGIVLGFFVGFPFKEFAILDGMVAGVMGGLMGIMLGAMIPRTGLYTITTLMALLFVLTWIVLFVRIHRSSKSTLSANVQNSL